MGTAAGDGDGAVTAHDLALAKLLDAPREWAEWQAFTAWRAKRSDADSLRASASESERNSSARICSECGYIAKSQNALNGHSVKHRKGKLCDIERRQQGNTAYICLICAQPIKRSESYQSWLSGWAHGRCVREKENVPKRN